MAQRRASAPSVVPKLSLGAGLVYTYTKPERDDLVDAWYLTALDFDNGKTRWRASPAPARLQQQLRAGLDRADGTAYVGVLGGIVRLAESDPCNVQGASR